MEQVPASVALSTGALAALKVCTQGTILESFSLSKIVEVRRQPYEAVDGIATELHFEHKGVHRTLKCTLAMPCRRLEAKHFDDLRRKLSSIPAPRPSDPVLLRSCPLQRLVKRRVLVGDTCQSGAKCTCLELFNHPESAPVDFSNPATQKLTRSTIKRGLLVSRFAISDQSSSQTQSTTMDPGVRSSLPKSQVSEPQFSTTKTAPVRESRAQGELETGGVDVVTAAAQVVAASTRSKPAVMPRQSKGVLMALARAKAASSAGSPHGAGSALRSRRSAPAAPSHIPRPGPYNSTPGERRPMWVRQWSTDDNRFYWQHRGTGVSRWVHDLLTASCIRSSKF